MKNRHNIRLLLLDLDGTMLKNDKSISSGVKSALQKAAGLGIVVLPASGRPFASLPQALFDMPGIRYAVTSNGAAVYRLDTREKCYSRNLTHEQIEGILSWFPEGAGFEASYGEKTYIGEEALLYPSRYGLADRTVRYLKSTRTPVRDIRSFMRSSRSDPECIDVILEGGDRERDHDPGEVIRSLTEAIPGVYATSSVPGLLEISAARGGKCEGLMWARETFGIEFSEMMSFGDGYNDLEMIRHAGIGVAMENAHPALIREADLIAPSNEDDGVAHVIHEWLLS